MDSDINDGLLKDYEGHWNSFKKALNDTFTDLAEGVNAEKELQQLHMKEGDVDTYIATFKKLLRLAHYSENEHGAVTMFKRGLPHGLAIAIIHNTATIPTTLEGWITATREQQLRYLQTQEFSKKGLSPQAMALAKKLGIRNNQ